MLIFYSTRGIEAWNHDETTMFQLSYYSLSIIFSKFAVSPIIEHYVQNDFLILQTVFDFARNRKKNSWITTDEQFSSEITRSECTLLLHAI